MSTSQPPTSGFYMLHDDELRSVASAAPRSVRRTPTKGADIGGRLRVARILQSAGVQTAESPVRIAGSTNEVWQAGDYIIRVGFQVGAERLRREARLAALLPEQVRYPQVVASGVEPFGEWIIVRRCEGIPLSQAWIQLSNEQRREIVFDLGRILECLHRGRVDDNATSGLQFHEGEGDLALPHQLPARRLLELLQQARYLHGMDRGFIDDVSARATAVADAIGEHERFGWIHGDLHFENVLVQGGRITAVLDFEWARPGPIEIDVDVLARFCHDPEIHVGGTYPIQAADFRDVLKWINQVYPSLFSAPDIRDRLFLCALAFDVPWLLRMSTNGVVEPLPKWHPINQIKDLMVLGSYAERLGWA